MRIKLFRADFTISFTAENWKPLKKGNTEMKWVQKQSLSFKLSLSLSIDFVLSDRSLAITALHETYLNRIDKK